MSLYTSLSGLKAAQTDLSTISNNIANVSTTGFKKSSTQFGDLISSSAFQAAGSVVGQGIKLKSISQEFSQGSFQSTDSALDVAISGEGFLITKDSVNGGQTTYTRNGALSVSSDSYLTDSNGNYVQVEPVDSFGRVTATGASSLQNLQLAATHGTAAATTAIGLSVALPSSDEVKTGTFSPTDANSYNDTSTTTVYDSSGQAIPATVYYVHTTGPAATTTTNADGSTSTTYDNSGTWEAHIYVGDKEVTPTTTLTFDASGATTSANTSLALGAVDPTGASGALQMTLNLGAVSNGASFDTTSISADGNTVGKLSNLTIGSDGLVTATYSDGASVALGKLALATFSNPQGLSQLGNSTWAATGLSGQPQIGEAGSDGFGALQSGALEASNVDLTAELVSLISAQRDFQANAKAIDTNSQMISTIIQMNG